MRYVTDIDSPLGSIRLVADQAAVIAAAITPEKSGKIKKLGLTGREASNRISEEAARQVEEFFLGQRKTFDVPICLDGMTPFSQTVLECLARLPYGELVSYGTLAEMSGRPQAARAVGRVMAANPIPIIVPCHRVVGSDGRLIGYSGGEGVKTKEWLLAFERDNRVS